MTRAGFPVFLDGSPMRAGIDLSPGGGAILADEENVL
jgi:hypothetical protein